MSNIKKLMTSATGGEAVNVEDVFSTYVYPGNDAGLTIINGIDLAAEGGLVWTKDRDTGVYHALTDTERGGQYALYSPTTDGQVNRGSDFIEAFNSNGYRIGNDGLINDIRDYVSWTFRKAPKFFDVVTWTGNGVSGRTISHNLEGEVGAIMVKRTDSPSNWSVFHRGLNGGTNPQNYRIELQDTAGQGGSSAWNNTAPTSTEFTVSDSGALNGAGGTYVAYVFAHNNGDGEFGPNGDADIIKCGSFTRSAVTDTNVNLGFEPQWVMVKKTSSASGHWYIVDTMRGIKDHGSASDEGQASILKANDADSEFNGDILEVTSTGFRSRETHQYLDGGEQYIYMAIRRGTKVPESAGEVFAVDIASDGSPPPTYVSGFPVDMGLTAKRSGGAYSPSITDRLRGSKYSLTSTTGAELNSTSSWFDYMNGFRTGNDEGNIGWMWKRATGFFDVVAYTGNGVSGRTVSHNLGVAPQLIWLKSRDNARSWTCSIPTGSGISTTQRLILNGTTGAVSQAYFPSQPTATGFSIISDSDINANGENYIAYLFASLPGISKVGSYTGTGAAQNIDCGFSAGARFVLIKDTTSAGPWTLVDSVRGISTGGYDPTIAINTSDPEASTQNNFNAYSSGFGIATGFPDINTNGNNYIFYAIA